MDKRFVLFFIGLLVCVCSIKAQNWDINALHKVNSLDSRSAKNASRFFSRSTPYFVLGVPAAIAVYGAIDKNRPLLKDALYIGTSVVEAFAITYGMKYAVDRPRPYITYPDRLNPYSLESSPSFPSTHTASAFALATSLSIRYPKWYVITPCALWACTVGLSRMHQGVHYPSDVVAGAVIGIGCSVVNVYVNRWLNKLIDK